VLSNIEVFQLDLAGKLAVFIVQFLEAALVGEIADLVIGADEDFGLSHGEIEGELAVWAQEVVLDLLVQELRRLCLHLIQVGQLELTHGKAGRHSQLPLDFIYIEILRDSLTSYQVRRVPSQP
jgi:uncharacterized protein YicC (UPF0701 family)